MQSLNILEIALNELTAITRQYEHSKEKLENYKKENQKAIELYNEQMSILCTYLNKWIFRLLYVKGFKIAGWFV